MVTLRRDQGGGSWWRFLVEHSRLPSVPPGGECRATEFSGFLDVTTQESQPRYENTWSWACFQPRSGSEVTSAPRQERSEVGASRGRG